MKNFKEIVFYLFDVMKINVVLEFCDLVICLYIIKDEKSVVILKLDYKKLYIYLIEFVDDKFNI